MKFGIQFSLSIIGLVCWYIYWRWTEIIEK